ncbi:MAG: 4'-phosphopantetheinyl transferase superfamily protein, partial [Planctomycetaceae bacterium]
TSARPPCAPEVGVDLERVERDRRMNDDLLRVAGRFAGPESAWLASLPAAEMPAAFYRLWTAKEACLKCLGTGIGSDAVTLADVACDLGPDGAIERVFCAVGQVSWRVRHLEPCPGHVAAVAMHEDDGPFDVVLRRLEPDASERRLSGADAPPPGHAPEAP